MTTRSRGRRSFARAPKKPMIWFNNGVDLQSLAGSTSLTSPLIPAGIFPDAYIAGFTILRLILTLTHAPLVALDVVNAVAAVYVATRGSLTVPPNLNASNLDYYLYTGLQSPAAGAIQGVRTPYDIRSKRRIRGSDRELFFRVTNNEVTAMQIGMEVRMLCTPS